MVLDLSNVQEVDEDTNSKVPEDMEPFPKDIEMVEGREMIKDDKKPTSDSDKSGGGGDQTNDNMSTRPCFHMSLVIILLII